MNRLVPGLALLAIMSLPALPLSAHHGVAVYDVSQTVSKSGLVSRFQFINPHVLISITVSDADGKRTEWTGELTSPNRLARTGSADVQWHRNLLKLGDEIILTGNPARNGAPAIRLAAVQRADGTMLVGGGR